MASRERYVRTYWDEEDEEQPRIFDPRNSRAHLHIHVDQLVVYNPHKEIRHLREMCPFTDQVSIDSRTVVVSIDGACRGNGTPSARAAWGVYFGPHSMHNASGILDGALPQTSTRAEIEGLSRALDIIYNDISRDMMLLHYRIRTDSSYLVKTFSAWIHGWMRKDGRNSRGKRAAHFDTLANIHDRLEEMTHGEYRNMTIKFWKVPRGENREADALANYALDREFGAIKRPGIANPRVLSISLHHTPFFESLYGPLLNKIRASSLFQRVEDGEYAIHLLLQRPRPSTVLITDEALTLEENAPVWDAVVKYVRQGGTAVLMGDFPYYVNPWSITPFFARAGLGWEQGSFKWATLVLNEQVVAPDLASRLLREYRERAIFLKNAKTSDTWYVTANYWPFEPSDFRGQDGYNAGESSVLLARVGKGKLGYVGDVNGDKGSEAVVLAMCGL